MYDGFDAFDTNGDGFLSYGEATQLRPTQNEFDAMDGDSDGALTLIEANAFVAAAADPDAEVVGIAQELIVSWTVLDANGNGTLSLYEAQGLRDAPLTYVSWRESSSNPALGLFPSGSEVMSSVQLSFPRPGTYQFSVQAARGAALSTVRSVQVFVPGVQGRVGISPSDGIKWMPNVAVRAYTDYQSAVMWQDSNNVMGSTYSDSRGYFSLDTLAAGHYWIAAKDLSQNPYIMGYGQVDFGPAGRSANAMRTHDEIEVNLRMETFTVRRHGDAFDGQSGGERAGYRGAEHRVGDLPDDDRPDGQL